MKKLLILSTFLSLSYSVCYSEEKPLDEVAQVGVGVDIDVGEDDDDDYYEQDIWIGPGLYYGVWFNNEWDYNDWYGHHGHHHGHHGHHDHHGGGHHHGGGGHHHGGGGHHGGGHGGGHHK